MSDEKPDAVQVLAAARRPLSGEWGADPKDGVIWIEREIKHGNFSGRTLAEATRNARLAGCPVVLLSNVGKVRLVSADGETG